MEYEQLKSAIDKIKIRNYEEFELGNMWYIIFIYSPSTNEPLCHYGFPNHITDGADIIVQRTVPTKFRKPIIFHEIAEFFLREPDHNTAQFKKSTSYAHPIAKQMDERYAKETLDETTFKEYMIYKEKNQK